MLIDFFPEKVDILQLKKFGYFLLFLKNLEKVDIFATFERCGYFPRKTRNYFFRKKKSNPSNPKKFRCRHKKETGHPPIQISNEILSQI